MISPDAIILPICWAEEVESERDEPPALHIKLHLAMVNSCLLRVSDSVGFGW